jgi:DNA-binding CsgD family transcriptional regulator
MTDLILDPSRGLEVLEAASREANDVGTWLDDLSGAVGRLLPSSITNGALLVAASEHGHRLLHAAYGSPFSDEHLAFVTDRMDDPRMVEPFMFESQHVTTLADIRPHLREADRRSMLTFLQTVGAQETLALMARSDASHALAIFGVFPQRERLSMRTRMALSRIALHIEAGLRLRLDPASLVAVLRPDGRFVHVEPEAQQRDVRQRIGEHVVRIDRARTKRQRQNPDTLNAWSALAAGRFGFVERSGPQREYLVYTNSLRTAANRAWSVAEARAVELSAAGMTGKLVAYALGVSDGEVSRLMARAAAKAGFASRTELVALAALLRLRPERQAAALEVLGLTPSERAVLAMLRRGLSNEEIAQQRNASVRTVANQVASVLRKTRLPSRRALATLSPPQLSRNETSCPS